MADCGSANKRRSIRNVVLLFAVMSLISASVFLVLWLSGCIYFKDGFHFSLDLFDRFNVHTNYYFDNNSGASYIYGSRECTLTLYKNSTQAECRIYDQLLLCRILHRSSRRMSSASETETTIIRFTKNAV